MTSLNCVSVALISKQKWLNNLNHIQYYNSLKAILKSTFYKFCPSQEEVYFLSGQNVWFDLNSTWNNKEKFFIFFDLGNLVKTLLLCKTSNVATRQPIILQQTSPEVTIPTRRLIVCVCAVGQTGRKLAYLTKYFVQQFIYLFTFFENKTINIFSTTKKDAHLLKSKHVFLKCTLWLTIMYS